MEASVMSYNFVVAILGFIFNSAVIFVTVNRQESNVTSLFLIMMSLADSLYLLFGPFTLFVVTTRKLKVSCNLYQMQTLFTHFSASETSMILCIIAVERIICIAFFVSKRSVLHRRILTIGCIVTSMVLFGMYCTALYTFAFHSHTHSCGMSKDFSYFDIIMQFVLPGSTILVSGGFIILSFRRLKHPHAHAQVVSHETVIFICLSASFAVFSTPLYVFELLMLHDWSSYNKNVHFIVLALYNTQASFKLFVYMCFVDDFRQGCIALLVHWYKTCKKHYLNLKAEPGTGILSQTDSEESDEV